MGGSSKKVTVGYRYFLGVHMIFCHGPVDRLLEIKVDKRAAWLGYSAGGQINVNSPQLFGGESREGGVSGTVDFETGSAAQTQNSYLVSKLGSAVPAFRGVVGLVLRQCYLGVNPYLKNWSARLQRIHIRQNGIAQWYDSKSQIGIATRTVDINLTVANAGTDPNVGYLLDNVKATDFVVIFRPDESMPYTAMRGWPAGHTDPLPWGHWFNVTGSDGSSTLHWYEWFATADEALAFAKAQSPVVRTGSTSYRIHIPDGNLSDNVGGESLRIVIASQLDMNPAHIIRECLTDPDWGMGYLESDVDDVSFRSAADALYSEGMGISILWDRQIPLEDFIKEIMRHIDAALYVDRKTGKFTLKLIRNDYVENDLLLLTENEIERVENYSRPAFGELVNSVTVNYWDSVTNGDGSITADDPALIQMQGAVIGTTIQYPGFTNGTIAAKAAMRDLRSLSIPRLSCTIYANKTAANLNIGDPFLFEWPDYHEGLIVMRVTGLGLGDGKTNRVRITCTQDTFDLPQITVVTPEVPDWADPTSDPTPAQYRVIVEAPYYELVQRLGQTTTDNQLGSNVDLGYILASAAAPLGAINGRLAIDAGAGYDGNDTAMDFCPATFLAADITPGQTSISITGGQSLSAITTGTHAQIGNELVKVSALTDTTMTAGRGVLDTVPSTHVAGTPVLFWDAYADSDDVEYIAGEALNVKILPTTGKGTLDVADAPTDVLTFASRAYRPYAPGNMKIGGVAYPFAIGPSEALSVTWSHRDRLQQTAGDIEDTTAGNIGPEVGTTYNLRIYGENNTLIHEELSLSGTSYTYPTAEELTDSGIVAQLGGTAINVTERTSSFGTDRIWTVAHGGGQFIAGGDNSKLATSSDGVTWTQRTSSFGASESVNGLAYNGSNLWVAVSAFAKLATSPDGVTWTQRTHDFTASIRCVAHNLSSLWVAAGDNGLLRTSTDGISWTGRTSQFGTTRIWAVAFGGGIWVAVGESGKLSTSTDGITWTARTSSFGTDTINDVFYGGGKFVAVGAAGKIATSTDGITWTQRTSALSSALTQVAYDGAGLWMVVSVSGTFQTSPDGVAWTSWTTSFTIVWRGVAHDGTGLWALVGDSGKLGTTTGIELLDVTYRLNGKLRVELESMRDGYISYQAHDYTVRRSGYGFNYGESYGGV